jgi:hypothetical protein
MKVRIVKPFGSFSVGQIIPEMPNNQARTLIGRGLAEEIETRSMTAAPANRAVTTAPVNRANQSKPALKLRQ